MASKSMAPTAALLPAIAVALLLVASALAQPHGVSPASPCNNGLDGEISDAVEGIVRDLLEMVQDLNSTITGLADSLHLTRLV